jgi:pSer/pThr/pTyr-binding forkhead associated (FHA) protein
MARLTFALEDGQEVTVHLTNQLTLGRAEDNDVVVNDERLSPRHAEVLPHPSGGYEVRDLGSATGTFVNQQRVESCRLIQGDRLSFGPLTAVLDLEIPVPEAQSAEEKQLTHWQAAARQSEAAHHQWLNSIAELTRQHDEKTATLHQLGSEITTARQQLAELTAQRELQAPLLAQLKLETNLAETHLTSLRQQITSLEQKLIEGESCLSAQKAEITAAGDNLRLLEQRRTQLEASLQTLGETEGHLARAEARLHDIETQHTALTAALDLLTQRQQHREDVLRQLQRDVEAAERQLSTRHHELTAETRRVEEARNLLSNLEKQCQSLAAQRRTPESSRSAAKPPAASPPEPSPPPPSPATPTPRIVAIDSPRFTIIPMKSERVVKRSTDPTPQKGA